MCSINGCVCFSRPERVRGEEVVAAGRRLAHRGPDACGSFFAPGVGLYHNRLSVMDPQGGAQPMRAFFRGAWYTIVYNGEIYNSDELRAELTRLGAVFRSNCDTETVLWSYILWGEDCPRRLNGIFAFAVYDAGRGSVFVARDRLGVKPFFFAELGGVFYFASEVKGLLAHAAVRPEVTREGLWQLFYLTPVTLPGQSVFRDIKELLPGYAGRVDAAGLQVWPYWRLKAAPFTGEREQAITTVRELLEDAVTRQLTSDVPLAVLLSGGLDSSAITAIAARVLGAGGKRLCTYSFEYEGNKECFTPTLFQPQGDDAFAAELAATLGCEHTVLTAPTTAVAELLREAALARDLPGQADVDSSLLYFCSEIKKRHTVLLSGECSDEIFGGYPWFYRPEMLESDFFPWVHDVQGRAALFDAALVRPDEGVEVLREIKRQSLAACPLVEGECDEDRVARQATWLSVHYFMANLLSRKDRMSMHGAVEVRVPFADHRILEYVFNIPWRVKFEGGVEKALLRNAMAGYLPERVLWRKKSPYPKTHNPAYEALVRELLQKKLARGGFLAEHLDRARLAALLAGEDRTWFGQLMARPQLLAWLCQLDDWFEGLGVQVV